MTWKIPLAEPDLGEEEAQAVADVVRSQWLTIGPVTSEFEREFASRIGVRHAFAVNNCTAALHLANIVVGVEPGDEVICPVLTFVASANASRYCGARVVLADVTGESDFSIDPRDIERLITPRTKAITVVHYGGYDVDMVHILAIAAKHGIKVIEDCAHSPLGRVRTSEGSTWAGSVGDVSCFSFFGNKNMTTGEGGMVCTNSDAIAERIRVLRSHGMTTLSFERFKGHAKSYDVVDLGYNYRGNDLTSALGLVQLRKVESLNQRRRDLVARYRSRLSAVPGVIVPYKDRDLGLSTCHIMPILLPSSVHCENIKNVLQQNQIQTSRHYIPLNQFEVYRDPTFSSKVGFLDNIVTLPLYPKMDESWIDEIVDHIASAVR